MERLGAFLVVVFILFVVVLPIWDIVWPSLEKELLKSIGLE